MLIEQLKKPRLIEGHDLKLHNYNYHISKDSEFEKITSRWNEQNNRTAKIKGLINDDDHTWCEHIQSFDNSALEEICDARGGYTKGNSSEIYKYHRDLRGLHFKNWIKGSHITSLDYTYFDFCLFSKCQFENNSSNKSMLFFQSSFSNSKFENCSFKNGWFFEGEMKDAVFYSCQFEDIIFNMNSFEKTKYKEILFINCNFKNCDLSRIAIRECCFLGDCSFESVSLETNDLIEFSTIGKTILENLTTWDKEHWNKRKNIKSVTFPGKGEPIVNLLENGKTQPRSKNKISIRIAYHGLIKFYEHLNISYDNHRQREVFTRTHYVLNHLIDEKYSTTHPVKGFLRSFPGRYIAGYGDKPQTPILAWLANILIFALLFSISGIQINNETKTILDAWQLGGTKESVIFLLKCVYFSAITTTTVGYGDIQPATGWSMLFSATNAAIGMFLYTTFTVVMVRRLFK